MADSPAPYLRIAAAIRQRIVSGELAAGARVPSTRQIVREHGVAMATAAKALGVLRDQGWVRTVPGGGTIVLERLHREDGAAGAGPVPPDKVEPGSTRDTVIRAAILLADRDGLTSLTMRRLAAHLNVAPMALYRYIPDKDELLRQMADVAFGEEELPDPGPSGWRAKLELSARLQWRAYRRHPWLPTIMHNSLVRPPAVPSGIRMVDWELNALEGLGLNRHDMLHTVLALDGYVGGIAASNALEVQAEHDTGITGRERIAADRPLHAKLFGSGRFRALSASVPPGATTLTDLDELFEFGLRHQLDGIAVMLSRAPCPSGAIPDAGDTGGGGLARQGDASRGRSP
ncbi:TetR/AcrR family transcriptional regulator C-terminal domain-containing protein [Actinomadura rubrisoli]|uniref:GntR family transcriptional regulator n=1 Tax=Actinomadura rubrisoli TaxID=2530368 RepID=A0A4R5CDZ0_9ACTN|nr:TetR/AcrR family transcriptional regulator C-terminal domain-containing protein [Actinomadura rubrisoli]TDD96453.1 GntR family transcriptional regulator [Actinomadura rubrisoli]